MSSCRFFSRNFINSEHDPNETNETPVGERNEEDPIENSSLVYLMQDAAKSVGIHPESNKIEENQAITYAYSQDALYALVNNDSQQQQQLNQPVSYIFLQDQGSQQQFTQILDPNEQLNTFPTQNVSL